MPREAELFDMAGGSIVEGYFLIKERGANIPPAWYERANSSRVRLHKEIAKILKTRDLDGIGALRAFELRYRKECFYYGIRALLELERKGKTRY
jgi:hypothetical protein